LKNTHVDLKRLIDSLIISRLKNPNLQRWLGFSEGDRRGIMNFIIGSNWCILLAFLSPYIVMGGQGFHHSGGCYGHSASSMRPDPHIITGLILVLLDMVTAYAMNLLKTLSFFSFCGISISL